MWRFGNLMIGLIVILTLISPSICIAQNHSKQPPPIPDNFNSHIDTLQFSKNQLDLDDTQKSILDKYIKLSHHLPENRIIVIKDLMGVSCGETKQNGFQWSRTENCIKYLSENGIKYNKLVWESGGLGLTGLKYVVEIRIKKIEHEPHFPPFPSLKR